MVPIPLLNDEPPREHAKVVKLLLQYGVNPYAKDVVEKTVCHYGNRLICALKRQSPLI